MVSPLPKYICIYNIITTPFYFTRGGYINLDTGSLRHAGVSGYYWADTANVIDSHAYSLAFNGADTYSSYSDARWVGFSVR